MNKKRFDQIFSGLLALGAVGHLFGTFKFFEPGTGIFVWSLSGALACALLVALNLLRTHRPDDVALRLISIFGNASWLAIVVLFGRSIGNLMDPRVVFHGIAILGLFFFSVLSPRRPAT